MSWLTAPPSDHELNTYVVPPTVWGELAVTEIRELRMAVIVAGVWITPLPTVSWRPAGWVVNVTGIVLGSSRTDASLVRPRLSVTRRRTSRYEGYSCSGAMYDPPATPSNVPCGCS